MAADQGSSAYAQTTPTNAYGPRWVQDSTAQVGASGSSAPVAAYAPPMMQGGMGGRSSAQGSQAPAPATSGYAGSESGMNGSGISGANQEQAQSEVEQGLNNL